MPAMRLCAAGILLALIAPLVIAIANAPAAQCQLSPCCLGKSASCPMHHPSARPHETRMSCAPAPADAVVPTGILPRATTLIAPVATTHTVASFVALSGGVPAPRPHVPPPQRLS
jgi:hypothetical protein